MRGHIYSCLLLLGTTLPLAAAPAQQHERWQNRLEAQQLAPVQAIRLYQRRLQQFPDWHRGRLELARLYYRTGKFTAARKQVRQVVKEAELPPVVQKNVLGFYRRILLAENSPRPATKTASRKWRSSALFSMGPGYDSNANTGPEDQDIGLRTVRLKADAIERSDHYVSTQLQLNVARIVAPQLQWQNQFSLFDRRYQQLSTSDSTQLRLGSQLKYQLSPQWQLGGRILLSHRDYGNGTRINSPILEPFTDWRQGDHRLRLYLQHEPRRYQLNPGPDRDSQLNEVGLHYRYRFDSQWTARLSARYYRIDDDDHRYDYDASEGAIALNYAASNKLDINGQIRLRQSDYAQPEAPLYSDARSERYTTLRLGLRYQLSDDLAVALRLTHYDNDANHQLHDYQRQQADFRLSWNFQGL